MSFSIDISDSAVARIKYILGQEEKKSYLRIAVESGGCSGFQYKYEFVDAKDDSDCLIVKNDVGIVIDSMSQGFLQDCILDYIENLGSAYFEIRNPQASAKCGCGNSFNI